jgi:hypothetical protein
LYDFDSENCPRKYTHFTHGRPFFGGDTVCNWCGFTGLNRNNASRELRCVSCNESVENFVITDGESVCSNCGAVAGAVTLEEIKSLERGGAEKKTGDYKRKFYFNEACKQWMRCEPVIPDKLFEYIERAYRQAREKDPEYWDPQNLDRAKIHALCRSISTQPIRVRHSGLVHIKLDPEDSLEYKASTGKPLKNFRKFGEKWRSIIQRLTGCQTLTPDADLLRYVCDFYAKTEQGFASVRHTDACDGRAKCHKFFGCRHSMISLNYVAKKALVSYYRGNKDCLEYQIFKKDWPPLSKERRKKIKQKYWYRICEKNGGVFSLWLGDERGPVKRGRKIKPV